jgi:hypothetical protein
MCSFESESQIVKCYLDSLQPLKVQTPLFLNICWVMLYMYTSHLNAFLQKEP